MQKIQISWKWNKKKKKAKKCWLIQLFLESINDKIFHHDLPAFPLILAETLAKYPLIQLSFSYFCFGAEMYKLKIFKNLPFVKITSREIRFFSSQ